MTEPFHPFWVEQEGAELIELTSVSSHGMRWDKDGRCFETVNGSPETRRPDCDFGTPVGDLLIDPWAQKILRDA